MNNHTAKTIEDYIALFPISTQELLEQLWLTINAAAPEAEESISYQMPAFSLKGRPLVYFAAYKNHIGFYPTASGVAAFIKELSAYKLSKGTVQFSLNEPLPIPLITKIVRFKVAENLQKWESKQKK